MRDAETDRAVTFLCDQAARVRADLPSKEAEHQGTVEKLAARLSGFVTIGDLLDTARDLLEPADPIRRTLDNALEEMRTRVEIVLNEIEVAEAVEQAKHSMKH